MKKKLFSILTLLLLSVSLLTGCVDKELQNVINAYANISSETIKGYTQTVKITQGDFSYESYSKQVEFNGASYKITENTTVLNEIGASERVTTTREVSYIDNGCLIKEVEGVLTNTGSATTDFKGRVNLRAEYFSSYSITSEDNKKVFTADIVSSSFSSFANSSVSGVNTMNITINLTNNKVNSSILKITKADGTEVVIEFTVTGRISNFAVPAYN